MSVTALGILDVAPNNFVPAEPIDISQNAAQRALDESQNLIDSMIEQGWGTQFVGDALQEARRAFENEDYETALKIAELIKYIHDDSATLTDQIAIMHSRMEQVEDGVDMETVHALMEKAERALSQEQFQDAHSMMVEAHQELRNAETEFNRQKLIKRLSTNVIVRYWWHTLLVLGIIGVLSYPSIKQYRKKRLKKKIVQLRIELEKINEMMKRMQKRCFVDKKMTTETYKKKVIHYEEKIAEIRRTIPVLEAQLHGKKKIKKKKRGVIEIK